MANLRNNELLQLAQSNSFPNRVVFNKKRSGSSSMDNALKDDYEERKRAALEENLNRSVDELKHWGIPKMQW